MLKRSISESDITSSRQQQQNKHLCTNPADSLSKTNSTYKATDSTQNNIGVYFNEEEIFLIPFTVIDQDDGDSEMPFCIDDSCVEDIVQKINAMCVSDKPDSRGFKHDISAQSIGYHIKANYYMGGRILCTKSIFNFTRANLRLFLKHVKIQSQPKSTCYRKASNRLSIRFCFVHLNFDVLERCNFTDHNPRLVYTEKITHYYQGNVEYAHFAVLDLNKMMVTSTNKNIQGFSVVIDKDDQNFTGQLLDTIDEDVKTHFDRKSRLVSEGDELSNVSLHFGKDSYSSNFFNIVYRNAGGQIRNVATQLQWNNNILKRHDIQKKQDVIDSVVNTSDCRAFFHRFREIYSDVHIGGINSAFVAPHLLQETAEKINKQLGSNEIIYGKKETLLMEYLEWVVDNSISNYCEKKMNNIETKLSHALFAIKTSIEEISNLRASLDNKKGDEKIIVEKKIQDSIKDTNDKFKSVAQDLGFFILRYKMNRSKFLVYLKLRLRSYVEQVPDTTKPLTANLNVHVDVKDVTMLEYDIKD